MQRCQSSYQTSLVILMIGVTWGRGGWNLFEQIHSANETWALIFVWFQVLSCRSKTILSLKILCKQLLQITSADAWLGQYSWKYNAAKKLRSRAVFLGHEYIKQQEVQWTRATFDKEWIPTSPVCVVAQASLFCFTSLTIHWIHISHHKWGVRVTHLTCTA